MMITMAPTNQMMLFMFVSFFRCETNGARRKRFLRIAPGTNVGACVLNEHHAEM